MALSNAISSSIVAKTVGWNMKKGDFKKTSPNLPQRIALLGQANTANQGGLSVEPQEVGSATDVANIAGYGSPLHLMARIIFRENLAGIPVVLYPQEEAGDGVAKVLRVDVTGTATKTKVHTLVVNGREGLDGGSYSFKVEAGDTDAEIAPKIVAAVNSVLSAPCTAVFEGTAVAADLTTKWAGLTADQFNVEVNIGDDAVGLTYAVTLQTAGAGTDTTDVPASLAKFGNEWNTVVVNPYGVNGLSLFEDFNGVPDPISPTGRYLGTTFKPFVCCTGFTESTVATIKTNFDTDSRKDQVTHALCPAPNSNGFEFEASANGAYLEAVLAQNNPHLDISGQSYPDMPIPSDKVIGDMADLDKRNEAVKAGISTVILNNGKYQIEDFITTYRPDGETPPQFRYVRLLVLHMNIRYGYLLLEALNVVDHAVLQSNQPSNAPKTIKPKQWIQILNAYADDLGNRALITDTKFMKDSIQVSTNEVNPDRFETSMSYKTSPYVRQAATTVTVGFAFGLN